MSATPCLSGFFDKLRTSSCGPRCVRPVRTFASACPVLRAFPDVAAFIQMVGFNCYEGYGLTETSPLVSANGWSGPGTSRLNSVGKVANGVKVTLTRMLGMTEAP